MQLCRFDLKTGLETMAWFSKTLIPKRFMQLFPNQGFLVTVDAQSTLEVFDFVTPKIRLISSFSLYNEVTCLYVPQYLDEDEVSIFSYLGFADGTVRIFSMFERKTLDFQFKAEEFFGRDFKDITEPVVAIQTDRTNPNCLLVAYEAAGAAILNTKVRNALLVYLMILDADFRKRANDRPRGL